MGKNGKAVEMSIDHKPESQTEIDRITGLIETVTLYWDTCKDKLLERRAFEGQCKKQDRAF